MDDDDDENGCRDGNDDIEGFGIIHAEQYHLLLVSGVFHDDRNSSIIMI